MLLLDTARYPLKDRAEIVRGSLGELAGSTVEPLHPDAPIQVRMRAWDLGDGCSLFNAQGSGLGVRRLSSHISSCETRNISFSIQPSGSARFSQKLARQHLLTLSRYTEVFDAPQPSAQQAAIHVLRALVRSFGAD